MKYSIHYYKGCPILDDADEIIIKYTEKDPELINFVQNWKQEQRIVINITTLTNQEIEENLSIFSAAASAHNIAILCRKDQFYVDIAAADIPFFFDYGIDSLDELVWQIHLGVSDIYIVNELGFSITKIKEAYEDKVNIRVFPNVAQGGNENIDGFNKFFIRPEDVGIYENYVDIFEFGGELDQQPIIYKIYKDERWLGNLNEIIIGSNAFINNLSIVPSFGYSRLNCNKRCAFNKCDICNHIKSVSEILNDKGINIKKEKKKNNEHKINETNM